MKQDDASHSRREKNRRGAAVQIIQEDGITTSADMATVSLGYGENLTKVMVTAEDGNAVQIYRITITRKLPCRRR